MRTEETPFTKIRYCGKLSPVIGDRTESISYNMEILGGAAFLSFTSNSLYASFTAHSLPHLLNFYRDLGALINDLQPGLTLPLPDGDPSEVDAMKVIYEADQIQKGAK